MSRKEQMFIRALTNGSLIERELLLCYSIYQFYNEMSLFIEEGEKRKKELDDVSRKYKRI